jgi:hypothetical protein
MALTKNGLKGHSMVKNHSFNKNTKTNWLFWGGKREENW